MKLEVNISKKSAILVFAAILILATTIGVIAYNSNPADPAVMGHTMNEVQLTVQSFSIGDGSTDLGVWTFCALRSFGMDDNSGPSGGGGFDSCQIFGSPGGSWSMANQASDGQGTSCSAICFK